MHLIHQTHNNTNLREQKPGMSFLTLEKRKRTNCLYLKAQSWRALIAPGFPTSQEENSFPLFCLGGQKTWLDRGPGGPDSHPQSLNHPGVSVTGQEPSQEEAAVLTFAPFWMSSLAQARWPCTQAPCRGETLSRVLRFTHVPCEQITHQGFGFKTS